LFLIEKLQLILKFQSNVYLKSSKTVF